MGTDPTSDNTMSSSTTFAKGNGSRATTLAAPSKARAMNATGNLLQLDCNSCSAVDARCLSEMTVTDLSVDAKCAVR